MPGPLALPKPPKVFTDFEAPFLSPRTGWHKGNGFVVLRTLSSGKAIQSGGKPFRLFGTAEQLHTGHNGKIVHYTQVKGRNGSAFIYRDGSVLVGRKLGPFSSTFEICPQLFFLETTNRWLRGADIHANIKRKLGVTTNLTFSPEAEIDAAAKAAVAMEVDAICDILDTFPDCSVDKEAFSFDNPETSAFVPPFVQVNWIKDGVQKAVSELFSDLSIELHARSGGKHSIRHARISPIATDYDPNDGWPVLVECEHAGLNADYRKLIRRIIRHEALGFELKDLVRHPYLSVDHAPKSFVGNYFGFASADLRISSHQAMQVVARLSVILDKAHSKLPELPQER